MNGDISLSSVSSSPVSGVELGAAGHPLLMLHGWGHTHRTLYPLGELLSGGAQVHLVDLPGFGESPVPPSTWGTREYADAVVEYLDRHRIERADLIGHSFGGRVGIYLAANYPMRVRRLILINSAGLHRTRSWRQQIRFLSLKLVRSAVKSLDRFLGRSWYAELYIPRFASADYLAAGPLRSILVKTVNEDLTSDATRIKAPTLLLWGERDTETPIELGRRLHELIPNSTLLALPDVGHNPFDYAGFHRVAYYILPFLREEKRHG